MTLHRLAIALLAMVLVVLPGCFGGDDQRERSNEGLSANRILRELQTRPLDLPRVDLHGRSIRQYGVAGRCWSYGAPDVGAIALPGVPGEAALGPWPRAAGPTVSGSGPGGRHADPELGQAVLERGPVYGALLAGPPRIVYLQPPIGKSRWQAVRTIWVSRPSYGGPVLVRGGRLDRPGRLGFGRRHRPQWELRLPAGDWPHRDLHPSGRGRPLAGGWRASSVPTRIRAPGCYAFQVDGLGFSYVLAFGVQRQ